MWTKIAKVSEAFELIVAEIAAFVVLSELLEVLPWALCAVGGFAALAYVIPLIGV